MSRFTAVAVLVLAATAAAVSITKCTDYDCKVGCKVVNFPTDTCVPHGGNTILKCTATAQQLFTAVKYNGTGCATPAATMTGVCNQCSKGDDGKYSVVSGCEGFSIKAPLLSRYNCDSQCITCDSTSVLQYQCLSAPAGSNATSSWAFVGTQPAKEVLTIETFQAAGCKGAAYHVVVPTGVCIPNGTAAGSTLFQC
jgi:hypothetical protein